MFFRITPIVSDRRLKSGRNLSGYYSEMNKAEVIKVVLEGYHCLSVACPLESSAVLFVFGLFGLRKQSCRIAIGGVFRRVPFPRAERKQSERIEISFGQNVKTALLSGNE